MLPSQIAYYNTLTEESKVILQQAALLSFFEVDYLLQNKINKITKKNISQAKIRMVIDNAISHGFFSADNGWRVRYTVEIEFLVFVYPEIKFQKSLWDNQDTGISFYQYRSSPFYKLQECLHTLLYQADKYKEAEAKFLPEYNYMVMEFYKAIVYDEKYEKYLGLISKDVIFQVVLSYIDEAMKNLQPLQDIQKWINKIQLLSNYPYLADLCGFEKKILFYHGQFVDALANKVIRSDIEAIKYLTEGNLDKSLNCFKQYLKDFSMPGNKMIVPSNAFTCYFYMTALLMSGSTVFMPVFQKIMQMIEKKKEVNFCSLFIPVVYDALDEQRNLLAKYKQIILGLITKKDIDYESLISILVFFLVNETIDKKLSLQIYTIIKKTIDGGYVWIGYEAAYVAKTWFDDPMFTDLFNEQVQKLNYQPVISKIHRNEEWEKSLNLLLGIKSKTLAKNRDDSEKTVRVVYHYNPNNNYLQPVLQTRTAKSWSSGRNIAMATFSKLEVKGLTEQDIRISKHIKLYSDYYYKSYEFDKSVFVDLIGHPYIFLMPSGDIPIEFVAAQIVVSVNKVPKGYQLITDLKKADASIFVEKETNTRYKVYNLTENQIRILNIINRQEIIVPESGKAKLAELLGSFSAEGMTVHSDLLTSDKNIHIDVKELAADSRIRVQLLPFGDGLKTELFSKPFGERPPYCKPGKGGKVLISNEKDVQLQVKRNLKQEAENEQFLLNDIQSLESLNVNNDLMSFDNPMDSLSLLDMLAKRQDICVVEWPEGEKFKLKGHAQINNMNIRITSGLSWFELQGELRVDEKTVLTLQQLLRLSEKGHKQFIELSPGEFLVLSDRLKKQLDNLRLFTKEDKKNVRLNKFASVGMSEFFDEIENLKADKTWKTFRQQIEKAKVVNAPVPSALSAELRAYQEDGFRWMARLADWNGGACLADDMGLGKTIQALAILLHRISQGAALVVCPVSVVSNWVSEAEKFAPTLRFKTLGLHTSNRKEVMQSLEAGDVLVTSYGLLQSEEKLFSEQEFATIVLDEAHVIKNYATKTSKATMQLKAGFRLALTGTPLQNHPGEIWNLFNFINPGLLGSLQHFSDTFVKSGDEQSKKLLKKMIAPFILRRTKTAVLDELPPKTEIVKKIQLTDDEMAFYEALRRQALENLSDAGETKHIQVLAEITKLRQASCNPLLIDPNSHIQSSKLTAFLDIIHELIENKHRALVFSQFVKHLAIVRRALDKQGISYQYLDGSSSQADRQRSVKEFQTGTGELFLISLKAGGLGLNLTAADYVLHLDPWWNPAVEDQASDRAHRIGQQRPVTIYRLVAENTIEEKIIQLHHRKRDLAERLLEGSDMAAHLSVAEMIELIREAKE